MRIGALVGCLVLQYLVPNPAWTQDVSVRAYLDRNPVGVNDQFVLNVEVSGTQQVGSEPELPAMDDFSVYLGSGTSTSMQVIGGRTSVSVTFQYRFQATREGSFEIGAVRFEVGGETFETEPITLTVTASAAPRPRQPGAANRGADIGPDDLFVTAEVNKRRVYQNEPIVVEYRLYTRVNVSSYSVTRLPGTAGFWVEEYEQPASPQVERVVRDGVQYATAIIRKVALFPTGSGHKTIEPMSIEAQVRVQRRSRDPFGDFFRMPSLLDDRVPVVVASQPVEVEVLPLPEEGRPRDFSGLVGDFDVTATLDRSSAATNEALTYRVRITGEGNVRTVTEPKVEFPSDFEVYPPELSEQIDHTADGVRGSKTFEYVLIPRAPGKRTIPAVELNYFDVGRKTYATVSSPALEVEITGDTSAAPGFIGRSRGTVAQLREDIRFIRIADPGLRRVGRSPLANPGLWLLVLLPLAAVGGAWGYRRHRDRLEGDVAYARWRRARRLARKRLRRARSLLSPDTRKEFYAEVGRALRGYLGDRLNVAEAGLVADDARLRLLERGVKPESADEYLACLDVCDRMRFAPVEASLADMTAFLERSERAMTELSRGLGR